METKSKEKKAHRVAVPLIDERREASLVKLKLENPATQLKPEESIALLMDCLRLGVAAAERADGKDLVVFIGNTGSGKSTFGNYLSGCEMVRKEAKLLGLAELGKVVIVKGKGEGGPIDEIMPIGHTRNSMTFLPEIAEDSSGSHYCDCPGFLDNRGFEINTANAVNIKAAFMRAQSLKIVLLINYHSLKADRARGLDQMIKICEDLFGNKENLAKNVNSILLGISRIPVPSEDPVSLSELKQFIAGTDLEDSFKHASLQCLARRAFIFDPLDELKEKEAWKKERILEEIAKLEPIDNPRSIFRTALTPADIQELRKLCLKMKTTIDSILEQEEILEGDFSKAVGYYHAFNQLRLIEHATVDRLVAEVREGVILYFREQIQKFHQQCAEETLPASKRAHNLLRRLLHRLGAFDRGVKEEVNRLLVGRGEGKQGAAGTMMQSHAVAHAKIDRQLQDLLLGAHLQVHALGDTLQHSLDEFSSGSNRLKDSLNRLIDSLQKELEKGSLAAVRLTAVHSLFFLARNSLALLVNSSQQRLALSEKASALGLGSFKEAIECALYARKLEIEFVSGRLEVLTTQEDHEWQIALAVHIEKMKAESSKYDQLLQVKKMEMGHKQDALAGALEGIEHEVGALQLEQGMQIMREDMYRKHQFTLCQIKLNGLEEQHHMDVEARLRIAALLAQSTTKK